MRYAPALMMTLGTLAGCGGTTAPLPSTQAARAAVEMGLNAWKDGRPSASLAEAKPGVDFVDFQWKEGKALSDYAILSDATGQGTQTVTVALSLKGEPPARQVQYMVFGSDPVHILRDEDYARAMNMDNSPAPPKKAGRRR